MRQRFVLIAALVMTMACSPIPLQQRPSCADRVAQAYTSTTPVKGAYRCLAAHYEAILQNDGIVSDSSWAQHNAAAGAKEPFVYETRLSDGGFVYREDVHTPLGVIPIDLILWVDRSDGTIENFVAVSRL